MRALKTSSNTAIPLDAAYIDSTFLSLKYHRFPKQQDSVDAIIDLIKIWLQRNVQNIVVIRPPALYGYEFLFTQIVQKLNMKIHMSQATFNDYQFIPELDNCFDRSTVRRQRIHLCSSAECTPTRYKWDSKSLVCSPQIDAKHICIIRPTATKWNGLVAGAQITIPHESIPNVHFVCYSNHSSYEEINDLLTYLKPKNVQLNVVPRTSDGKSDMQACLQAIMKKYECEEMQCEDRNVHEERPISFGNILAKLTKSLKRENSSRLREREENDFVQLVAIKRRKRQ